MVAYKVFGPKYLKEKSQEPKAFKGKVPRGEEACNPQGTNFDVSQQYADCLTEYYQDGYMKLTSRGWKATEGSHSEETLANGNSRVDFGDGSSSQHFTGTSRTVGKNGRDSSFNGNSDTADHGGRRMTTGNQDSQSDLPQGGATYTEDMGYTAKYAAMDTAATSAASGRSSSHIGKYTVNAEGGIGFGVNKGSAMKVFHRMEPDGTYHIQVTPQGTEGGNAVVKIKPDGSILVTSESTLTIETKGTTTMKAPKIVMDTPLVVQTGRLETAESHTVPFCHSCADKAKSSC